MKIFLLGSLSLLLGLAHEAFSLPSPGERERRLKEEWDKLPKTRDHLAKVSQEDMEKFPYLRTLKQRAEKEDFPPFNMWETGIISQHVDMPGTEGNVFGPWDQWISITGDTFDTVSVEEKDTPPEWWGKIYICRYERKKFIPKPGEISSMTLAYQNRERFPAIMGAEFLPKASEIQGAYD